MLPICATYRSIILDMNDEHEEITRLANIISAEEGNIIRFLWFRLHKQSFPWISISVNFISADRISTNVMFAVSFPQKFISANFISDNCISANLADATIPGAPRPFLEWKADKGGKSYGGHFTRANKWFVDSCEVNPLCSKCRHVQSFKIHIWGLNELHMRAKSKPRPRCCMEFWPECNGGCLGPQRLEKIFRVKLPSYELPP